ncbi:hypothetical protein LTR95_006740, partial [Oleoguttula sp. CCFEE 5521]
MKHDSPSLLRLPAELHDAIFAYVFDDTNYKLYASPHTVPSASTNSHTKIIAPLLVCRALHSAATDALYKMTTFELLTNPYRPNPYICDHGTAALPDLDRIKNVVIHVDNMPSWSEQCRRCYRGSYDQIAAEVLCQVPNASRLSHITVAFSRSDKAMQTHGQATVDVLRSLVGKTTIDVVWQPGIVDLSDYGRRSPLCVQCVKLRRAWACLGNGRAWDALRGT